MQRTQRVERKLITVRTVKEKVTTSVHMYRIGVLVGETLRSIHCQTNTTNSRHYGTLVLPSIIEPDFLPYSRLRTWCDSCEYPNSNNVKSGNSSHLAGTTFLSVPLHSLNFVISFLERSDGQSSSQLEVGQLESFTQGTRECSLNGMTMTCRVRTSPSNNIFRRWRHLHYRTRPLTLFSICTAC